MLSALRQTGEQMAHLEEDRLFIKRKPDGSCGKAVGFLEGLYTARQLAYR
jgi:hypothetical protein